MIIGGVNIDCLQSGTASVKFLSSSFENDSHLVFSAITRNSNINISGKRIKTTTVNAKT